MGTYAGVDYNSPYLIVNSVVSYPPPCYKRKGVEWGKSLLLVYHICNRFYVNTSTEMGEGKGES